MIGGGQQGLERKGGRDTGLTGGDGPYQPRPPLNLALPGLLWHSMVWHFDVAECEIEDFHLWGVAFFFLVNLSVSAVL